MSHLVVIAIGGNSLIKDAQHMTVYDQYKAAGETSAHIAEIVERGHRVLITHGNGPQVGFILLRSEMAKEVLHEVPLDTCGADTQGALGYQIAQTLDNELRRRGIERQVVAVVTQTVVDREDPGFADPSKPIGPFYSAESARQHRDHHGWIMKEDSNRGWRRVVASPRPLEIVELGAIKTLLDHDVVVVAAGGGGIPVIRKENGDLEGIGAVIDKDRASCLLAKRLGASYFVISTSVDKVAINYGKPDQQDLDEITVAEAKRYLAAGHFAPGSMKPKIESAIDFLENGGQQVIITQPHLLRHALTGGTGTHLIP